MLSAWLRVIPQTIDLCAVHCVTLGSLNPVAGVLGYPSDMRCLLRSSLSKTTCALLDPSFLKIRPSRDHSCHQLCRLNTILPSHSAIPLKENPPVLFCYMTSFRQGTILMKASSSSETHF
ncbi:hypothetical protein TNCV_2703791 [Trichonephila clavipes]|nr:hypothetical protein TNCV_2703791 [Trichonephila clavipes]